MKEVKITNSDKVFYVDDEDYERVNQYNWRFYGDEGIITTSISIGQFLLPNKYGTVDHIDQSIFNNSKSNLRKATHSQNSRNRRLQKNSTTGFKGVSWNVQSQKFYARITINNKEIFLGRFNSKIEAAKAYNEAASKYHGQFAVLNIIKDDSNPRS